MTVNAIVNDILILGSSYDVNVDGKLLTRNRVETTRLYTEPVKSAKMELNTVKRTRQGA